jgi:hemerythrin-like metal-binding protein
MAILTWSSKYSVGVASIDEQHHQLFDMLNDLHTAMMNGHAKAITGELMTKLVQYTRTHFSSEEGLMNSAKYPGLAEHRLQHQKLLKQVEDYSGRYQRGEITLSLHLLNFLRDWLTNHIQKEDHAYAPYLAHKVAH